MKENEGRKALPERCFDHLGEPAKLIIPEGGRNETRILGTALFIPRVRNDLAFCAGRHIMMIGITLSSSFLFEMRSCLD